MTTGLNPLFMRIFRSKPRHARRGFSTAMFAVFLPVLILMTWWAAEYGLALRSAGHARTAADAIALAAAGRYRDSHPQARADALAAAAANRSPNGSVVVTIAEGPGGGGDVEFGRWDDATRTFTPDVEGGPAVRVRVRFDQAGPNGSPSQILRGMFGTAPVAIERSSVAVNVPPRHMTSMLLQNGSSGVVDLAGSCTLRCKGGVSVASADALALTQAGGARVRVPVVRSAGPIPEAIQLASDGAVEPLATIAADPFADTMPPAFVQGGLVQNVEFDPSGITHLAPGRYTGLTLASGTVILDPGLHQFEGGVQLEGSAELQLDQATIQLLDGTSLELAGDASVTGTPSTNLAGWPGFWLLQSGASPAAWLVAGNASVVVAGDMYAPASTVSVQDAAQFTFGTAVLGGVVGRGNALIQATDDIDALRTEPVPGRARLVR
jgi:Flp pilus assembly protein TadG